MEPTGTQDNRSPEVTRGFWVSREDPRAARILARSLYKDMIANGLASEQILAVTSELIGMVTNDLKGEDDEHQGTA